MSRYTHGTIVGVKDRDCLIKALMDMGFKKEQIEIHDKATNLHGYQGDTRKQKAHVIIRKQYVGGASNDLGFEHVEGKGFVSHISDYDKSRYNAKWEKKLMGKYNVHEATKLIETDNDVISWEETVEPDGTVKKRAMIAEGESFGESFDEGGW